MRHLLSILDLTEQDFFRILDRGIEHAKNRKLAPEALADKTVTLLFEKTSTRTRLSFSVAVMEMGGHLIALESQMLQVGRGESVEDTTEVLARYVDCVMVRTHSHRKLEVMSGLDRLPIINGLSDRHHPCQGLADYMTLQEAGLDLSNVTLAFVGEPNNVFNSLALGAVHSGSRIHLAAPEGYPIRPAMRDHLQKKNVHLEVFQDPAAAVKDADVVYTDTWISMGQEEEAEERRAVFKPFRLDDALMEKARNDVLVMHCLPAHRGEEITDSVMDKHGPTIFKQAENRLHIQKAILEWIFELI
ncbi:MAG: ornithine carbamoyltransferase [Leptospiraceae bacterium]